MFKKGDLVAYATKDWHGMQYIFAEVTHDQIEKDQVYIHLQTLPNKVYIAIPSHVLTKVKTVWHDTMRLVNNKKEVYIKKTHEENPRWYACISSGRNAQYLGEDGNMYSIMAEGKGTYFKSKGALIDHFLNIGIDIVEVRK